jgi:hypothetical protein
MSKLPAQPTAVFEESDSTWVPEESSELLDLLKAKFENYEDLKQRRDREALKADTFSILRNCVKPDEKSDKRNTGLIVGYVQSGKTLSFTSVIAAAGDNGYRMVVVVAGASKLLRAQNQGRLEEDLRCGEFGDPSRPWYSVFADDLNSSSGLESVLQTWEAQGGENKTILVTVLKHYSRINNLASVLREIPTALTGTVLIIDDEADYASLNTNAKKPEADASKTYKSINRLREVFPRHTLLQYTATPQANIFVHFGDSLAPDFCKVLKPGSGYLGGKYLLKENSKDFVVPIRQQDLPRQYSEEPIPESLEQALQDFLLGVAVGLHRGQIKKDNRSMLVHPDRSKDEHLRYEHWINTVLVDNWWDEFRDKNSEDREEFLAPFRTRYQILCTTSKRAMPEFEVIEKEFPRLPSHCQVKVLNDKEEIVKRDWRSKYAWILIGGQKLDRGLTVEGLTVSYIPRDPGQGNADSIQQRARFFGYKKNYEDLIKIYMPADVHSMFRAYVDSESCMRKFLKENSAVGALKNPDLVRRFQLDPSMKPCRANVILNYPRRTRPIWFDQDHPLANHDANVADNYDLVKHYASENGLASVLVENKCDWLRDPENSNQNYVHRLIDGIPLKEFYESLLTKLQIKDRFDANNWFLCLDLIDEFLTGDELWKEGQPMASIVFMRPNQRNYRTIKLDEKIPTIPTGPQPTKYGEVYKGDSKVYRGHVTLQIYKFDLHPDPRSDRGASPIEDVTTLRLWLHKDVRKSFAEQAYLDSL